MVLTKICPKDAQGSFVSNPDSKPEESESGSESSLKTRGRQWLLLYNRPWSLCNEIHILYLARNKMMPPGSYFQKSEKKSKVR